MNNIPKKWLITIGVVFLLFNANPIYAQSNGVTILVGKTDDRIRAYLDSLNNLRSNPYYKIEKDVSPEGALILKSGFAISDQDLYKCLDVSFLFKRSKGTELCVRQLIYGYTQHADIYLNYLKDNFKSSSPNTWEYIYPGADIKCVAEFKKMEKDTFYITYTLEPSK